MSFGQGFKFAALRCQFSTLDKNTAYLGGDLATRLGIKARSPSEAFKFARNALPTTNPLMEPQRTDAAIISHFNAVLTRHGVRGDKITSEVNRRLVAKYGVPNAIPLAVNALKPIVKYNKSKVRRSFIPIPLFPKTAEGMAMRWIVEAAEQRTYVGGNPEIVRGLFDEIDSIIQGTSSLFQKRFQAHKNPN